jgi:hypothetical protein
MLGYLYQSFRRNPEQIAGHDFLMRFGASRIESQILKTVCKCPGGFSLPGVS